MGRRLGQHFLTDPRILDRIVAAAEPQRDDVVIEIGPGQGTLTWRLAPSVHRVIAIERDRRLVVLLGGKGKGEKGKVVPANVEIVEADALAADWEGLVMASTLSPSSLPPFKVLGNIPYYITTPLIERALGTPSCVLVVFLVQREVADRLAAVPGSKTYGALSAGVQAVATVERLFPVRRGAFHPPPAVDSALVRLRPRTPPLVGRDEREAWRAFLARLFSQRRKQLGRSLRRGEGSSKQQVADVLRGLDIDPAARPESLSPGALVRLFRAGT